MAMSREEVESLIREKLVAAGYPIVERALDDLVERIIQSGVDPEEIQFRPRTSAKPIDGPVVSGIPISDWISEEVDLSKQYVVIDFWATWCKPCLAAMPHMNDLYHQFKDRARFLGLSKEPKSRVIKSGKAKFDYLNAVDTRGLLSRELGVSGIPHIVILNPNLKVIWRGHPNQLTAAFLDSILPPSDSGPSDSSDA